MSSGISIKVNGTYDDELTQAVSIEVSENAGQTSTFTLRYNLDILDGDLPYLNDNRFDPGSELSIMVSLDDVIICLVKGPVHGQQIHLKHGGAGSCLDVKGSDTSIKMDRETQSKIWQDGTDSDAIETILSQYGYTTDVQNTSAGHFENKHSLVQRESDLSFIRRLARRNGFYFWITCDDSGIETAHFKRPQLDGTPDQQLVINLASPSISTLDIEWDAEQPTSITGKQVDLNTKNDIDVSVARSPLVVLGDLGLCDIASDTRSVHLSSPADDAGDLQSRGESSLIEADWFIHASCQTTVKELGAFVRANTVIEIHGAGTRHSGKYFVSGVRHIINATEHKMEIELIRNGWAE